MQPQVEMNMDQGGDGQGFGQGPGQHPVPAFGTLPQQQLTPTVKPVANFNPSQDAQALRRAMKGFGTDETAIVEILGKRSLVQRLAIAKEFPNVTTNRDLVKDLDSETSGNLRSLLKGMFCAPDAYDAYCLRAAMKGIGCNDLILAEVLCTRTPAQLEAIKSAYQREYSRDLVKDVDSETGGSAKALFYALLAGTRDPENAPVNQSKAQVDAKALYSAGEKKWGTDEKKFIDIFTTRSYAHLRQTFIEYGKVSDYDIAKSIKREMSGTLELCFLAMIGAARDPAPFFAQVLKDAMDGLGTNDKTLIRVVTTRSEIDLGAIKEAFAMKGGRKLRSWVSDDCNGDYKQLLYSMLDAKM